MGFAGGADLWRFCDVVGSISKSTVGGKIETVRG